MTKWKTLNTEDEYDLALKRTIEIFHAAEGTPEGKELDLPVMLVKEYEDVHYPIPAADPQEVIKLKLEEQLEEQQVKLV